MARGRGRRGLAAAAAAAGAAGALLAALLAAAPAGGAGARVALAVGRDALLAERELLAEAGPGRRLSGKKAKKGKKGKGKGNGKKPHIKTIDGVNPGGWLDGAQGSSEWDEDLQAIDDVTGDYVHDPFIDDVTGDYVAPPDDSD